MFARVSHVRLAGFCAAVPAQVVRVSDLASNADKETAFTLRRVASLAGLAERRVANESIYTGDLALAAGHELMLKLGWDPDEISMLFFVSQTPDFVGPPTGQLVAHKLGLNADCAVFDIGSGCPGMIQTAWLAAAHLNENSRRALILTGDVSSKLIPKDDIGNSILMGDAVGACAIEYDSRASGLSFMLRSYPDTGFALVNYGNGCRPADEHGFGMHMDGNKVTEFCMSRVPQCIMDHLGEEGMTPNDLDALYLHQPNKMILSGLQRRLKIDIEKIPMIFDKYANCSGASVALDVCSRHSKEGSLQKAMFCGFGSGLAVASMLGDWDTSLAFPVVELERGALLADNPG